MSPVPSTGSSRKVRPGDARRARTYSVPWRRALLRWMPKSAQPGLNRLYSAIGWRQKGTLSSATNNPDLRLSTLVKMADAMRVDRLEFMRTVIQEYERSGHLPPRLRRVTVEEVNDPEPLPDGARAPLTLGT